MLIAAITLALLVSGCLATNIKPPVSEIKKISSILVVPVESPPLEIIPDPIEQRDPAYSHFRNMSVDFPLQEKLYKTSGGIIIAGLISPEDDEPDIIIQNDQSSSSMAIVDDAKQAWTPTLFLAQQALKQLTRNNIKTILNRYYYRLPMVAADRNAQLSHWHGAIANWYEQNMTTAAYKPSAGFDAILEVGIGQYRVFEGQTSVQVLMKLIDANTGQVIARTRAETFSIEYVGQNSLHKDSEAFKLHVSEMLSRLLKQGLTEFGWRL